MSDKKMNLSIATPDRKFYEGEVDMVIVSTTSGEIGILPSHMPLVSILEIGKVDIKVDNEVKVAAINKGFIQVSESGVSIFTDSAEWPGEIDLERAKEAKKRAEDRLKAKANLDTARAENALKRAINRIDLKNN